MGKSSNYNALNIAAYIITKSNLDKNPVDNQKLNKLLYLIQVESIKTYKRKMFEDVIIKGLYGVIVPDVYDWYRLYVAMKISYIRHIEDLIPLDVEDRLLIDNILQKYKTYNGWQMIELNLSDEKVKNTNEGDVIVE